MKEDVFEEQGHAAASNFEIRILIVGRDDEFNHCLISILNDAGFDCRHAPDAHDAVRAMYRVTPDLILLVQPHPDSQIVFSANQASMNLPVSAIRLAGPHESAEPLYRIEVDDNISEHLSLEKLLARLVENIKKSCRFPFLMNWPVLETMAI